MQDFPVSRSGIDAESDVPVYRQIADAIARAISDGELGPGDRLPPTRALGEHLGVNRNTVVAAYDVLSAEGFVVSHTGRGTFVADRPGDSATVPEGSVPGGRDRAWFQTFSRAVEGPAVERLLSVYRVAIDRDGISFAGSYPAVDLMPVDRFRRSMEAVLKRGRPDVFSYGPTAGLPELREALAREMAAHGSPVSPDHVLVTNGAQQAMELTFRTFLDPGDVVLLEDPTYTGALSALGSLEARAVGVACDQGGVRPDFLAQALERYRPRLIYLQPTFHNPTTRVMPDSRRREVLALAVRHGCPVVEDDWAGDLGFDGDLPATLHALDGGEHVIHLGTFSKKLMPALRIGWVAAPPRVVNRLVALKQITDCGTSPILQAALADFLDRGFLEDHLHVVRGEYRARRDRMVDGLRKHFPEGVYWTEPEGGLFLWVTLPEGMDSRDLFSAARLRGVLFSRGSLFHVDGQGANTLRLTYASAEPDRIEEGVRILGELIRGRWPTEPGRASETFTETIPVL